MLVLMMKLMRIFTCYSESKDYPESFGIASDTMLPLVIQPHDFGLYSIFIIGRRNPISVLGYRNEVHESGCI